MNTTKSAIVVMGWRDTVRARLTNEDGEISSWLILAAGLAMVALLIGNLAYGWVQDFWDNEIGTVSIENSGDGG